MQSGVENQLGRIKQWWRILLRSSGTGIFMQKEVEDQRPESVKPRSSGSGRVMQILARQN